MSRYLDKQIAWFDSIQRDMDACSSGRHRTILRNYMSHAAYELVGQTEALFSEALMVEEPVYIISGLGEPERREYRGRESVRARFYDNLNEGVVLVYDESRAVADWGLAMFCTVSQVMWGHQLAAAGAAIDDRDARYIIEHLVAERWPFDDRCRVIGEEVHQIGEATITRLAPEDDVTIEQRNAAILRYLPDRTLA